MPQTLGYHTEIDLGTDRLIWQFFYLTTHPYYIHPYILPAASYRMFASPLHENQA